MFLSSFDICVALDCVKKICENNHCIVCDKAAEEFLRYSCGHTACESCASGTDCCYNCLTPDQTTSNNKLDEVSKQRAVNASVLLKAFEKAFCVDVFRHQRMSEQLKLEKDLFPECIQAPRKYSNKRKSLNTIVKKKKNRPSVLPGEVVSRADKRTENSITSVQQWLNSNKENVIKNQNKDENEESGIVIDASDIDCSQITIDKDEQALLAVYEADKNELRSASAVTIQSEEWEDNGIAVEHSETLKDQYKVPFFKKSKLAKETNLVCHEENNVSNESTKKFDQMDSLQITICYNNQSLKSRELIQKETSHAHSISVQTDICELSYLKELDNSQDIDENSCLCISPNVLSQDVFTTEELHKDLKADTTNIRPNAATKSVIIEESDSDGSAAEVAILEVSAQVHNIEHPVFSDITYIDSHEQFKRQQRRRTRRLTPDSSNSSEKENLNPNKRQKKSKYGKKSKK